MRQLALVGGSLIGRVVGKANLGEDRDRFLDLPGELSQDLCDLIVRRVACEFPASLCVPLEKLHALSDRHLMFLDSGRMPRRRRVNGDDSNEP
jgi:hypothetical protein